MVRECEPGREDDEFDPRLGHIKIFLVFASPTDRNSQFSGKFFRGGSGYIYRKSASLYKNILIWQCTWSNSWRSVELVYVFQRTQTGSSVLPMICTLNKESCSTLGLGFVSNAKIHAST